MATDSINTVCKIGLQLIYILSQQNYHKSFGLYSSKCICGCFLLLMSHAILGC